MIKIYLITNLLNKKLYVGQTSTSLLKRWARHCWISEKKKNMPIGLAIAKYGKSNFTIEEIDSADSLEEANQKEVFWAIKLNTFCPNGYNLKAGGRKFLEMSALTKQKISLANKGRKASIETRRKLSVSHTGYKVSDETKAKLSNINKGKKQHPNTLAAIKKTFKSYILLSPDGKEIRVDNMAKFCVENHFQKTNMSMLCTGKIESYKGWKLIENLGQIYQGRRKLDSLRHESKE